MKSAQQFSHYLLETCIKKGDLVVDATAGNGHDSVFLASLIGQHGQLYSFDIQKQAIEQTRLKLSTLSTSPNIHLIHDSHEHIVKYIDLSRPISAVIFNLGYLPGGDKQLITKGSSTITAIQQLEPLIKPKGRIVLVCYTGHHGGKEEFDQILSYIKQLPQKEWDVLHYQFLNQKNSPPICLCIEKK